MDIVQPAERQCELLGGAFSIILQGLLGFAALSTLVYKRLLENPRRPILVWLYDTSKQAIGAGLVHAWNMALSIAIAKLRRDQGDDASDECALYFVNYAVDILLGTGLIWGLVQAQVTMAKRLGVGSLRHTGFYGDPPRLSVYLAQLLAFMFILVIQKTALAFLVIALDGQIEVMAEFLFLPLQGYPDLELLIVMILCPWCLNSVQFWILDSVVMFKVSDANAYKQIEDVP
ncbi:vacuolar membrane protein-domain-containing protein [Tribonema minus]|uniref:Vacuolar membrane protein-domain-containing protein n=1 Tax=Tribonema minus TaxID=303371 RepID=A0A836CKC4_9STRA|nr:vacuolar membrane protein-domain-containing protein [Tribonema minus]|eukprot:TRINITY_DN4050_c0_g2_i1.p1 TRINITY_DN4050_c0_g2~~TRINITY_DN4050_c0_g2_i1.p1  ORF type:complete len:231 (-),score=69.79 TRINITY_DN4050_c0_g2_i1:119-811(-)